MLFEYGEDTPQEEGHEADKSSAWSASEVGAVPAESLQAIGLDRVGTLERNEPVGRVWQARPTAPVVSEDDEWAEGRRLSRAELSGLVRRLRTRDRALLQLLEEHRYLTTEQVAGLLFPNLGDAQKRLLQLRPPVVKRDRHGTVRRLRNEDGLGLLMRWSRAHAGNWHKLPAVYLLRQKGALVLAAMRGEDAKATQQTVTRAYNVMASATHLNHDLGVVGFFAGLAVASRPLADQGLLGWIGETAMRRGYREAKAELAPDGWGSYLVGGRRVKFLLEWDEDTEPVATITSKAKGYGAFYHRKAGGEHILWVAPRATREGVIRSAIERSDPDLRYVQHWTTDALTLATEGPLGPIWRHLSGGPRRALPSLEGSPTEARVEDCFAKPRWWERRGVVGEP